MNEEGVSEELLSSSTWVDEWSMSRRVNKRTSVYVTRRVVKRQQSGTETEQKGGKNNLVYR